MTIENRLEELGIELPAAPLPKANYNIVCLPPGENILYVSGHLPIKVRQSIRDAIFIFVSQCIPGFEKQSRTT